MLTAFGQDELVQRAVETGVFGYLTVGLPCLSGRVSLGRSAKTVEEACRGNHS
jgi:hypothetical protein